MGGLVPAITVGLPAALTSPQPARDVSCEASTVGEALLAVVAQAPQYEQRIFYGDRLLVVVTLNGKHLPPTNVRETSLAAGDHIEILLPVAGG
jgi:sulfur carrier protein ThiS